MRLVNAQLALLFLLSCIPSLTQGQDSLGVTQRLYTTLNNEIDTKLRQYGFLPTLNVLLTYQIR